MAIIGAEDWKVNYDTDLANDEFDDKTIDSPVENMAIYQELMTMDLDRQLNFLISDFSTDDITKFSSWCFSRWC